MSPLSSMQTQCNLELFVKCSIPSVKWKILHLERKVLGHSSFFQRKFEQLIAKLNDSLRRTDLKFIGTN